MTIPELEAVARHIDSMLDAAMTWDSIAAEFGITERDAMLCWVACAREELRDLRELVIDVIEPDSIRVHDAAVLRAVAACGGETTRIPQ